MCPGGEPQEDRGGQQGHQDQYRGHDHEMGEDRYAHVRGDGPSSDAGEHPQAVTAVQTGEYGPPRNRLERDAGGVHRHVERPTGRPEYEEHRRQPGQVSGQRYERQGRAEDDRGDHTDRGVPEALEQFRGQDQRRNGTARDPQKRDSELGVGQSEGILHLGDPWRPTGEDRAVDEEDRPQGEAGETELAVRHEAPRAALPVVVCVGPGRDRNGASSDLSMRIAPGSHKGPSTPAMWTESSHSRSGQW